jgi:hypothetical protein
LSWQRNLTWIVRAVIVPPAFGPAAAFATFTTCKLAAAPSFAPESISI